MKLCRSRHSVTEWNLLSRCARAYEWTFIRPVLMSSVMKQQSEEVSARELGSRIHLCLEREDFDGLKNLEAEGGSHRITAEPLIHFALNSPLMVPLYPEGFSKIYSELAFEVPLMGEVLVGAIDRLSVMKSKSGKQSYQMIDFKVSRSRSNDFDLLESYQTQMILYREALLQLEPESQGNVSIHIVQIYPGGVQSVQVPDPHEDSALIANLVKDSRQIIDGATGVPNPSSLCRYCEFRLRCPEGQAVESKNLLI